MKAERKAAAVELACHISDWLQIAFRFISDWQSEKLLKIQILDWFRLVQIDSSDFRLGFQISDWLQIGFRFISDCSLKNRRNFRFQIGSDWLQNELLWIYVELFCLQKFSENADKFFYIYIYIILSIF